LQIGALELVDGAPDRLVERHRGDDAVAPDVPRLWRPRILQISLPMMWIIFTP
jgi:hypothetical protein